MDGRVRTSMLGVAVRSSMAALLGTIAGCCTSKECQLEQIAKDWCNTIRASQIVPVYPLTEDLQPGDIFLVKVPIERQQSIYRQKGFVPLDQHLARLDPEGYREFYDHSMLEEATGDPMLPRSWTRPGGTTTGSWQAAPGAAFPSYSFSVRRGSGLSLAVPVQGVPVGLGLMGSDSADGSLSIERARTIGVDAVSMFRQVQDWALTQRTFLANFAPPDDGAPANFLRVVTRVYATGKIDILLNDASSSAAGLDVGAPKPLTMLDAVPPTGAEDTKPNTIANYAANLDRLNETLSGAVGALPGGSLRVTAAAGRSVSMSQEFDPPLVIGYLGFDVAILAGGAIGQPISTHVLLERDLYRITEVSAEPAAYQIASAKLQDALYTMVESVAGEDAAASRIKAELDRLIELVPETFANYVEQRAEVLSLVRTDAHRGTEGYRSFRAYRAAVEAMVKRLGRALGADTFRLKDGQDAEFVTADDSVRERVRGDLSRLESELRRIRAPESEAQALGEALDLVNGMATPRR